MTEIGPIMEVILYVENMAAQVAFYRDVMGLKVREPLDVADIGQVYWVEFDTGACALALHGGGQRRFGEDAPGVVFRVAKVKEARDMLSTRGVSMGEIRSPAPGVKVCDGIDPESNRFSLESR